MRLVVLGLVFAGCSSTPDVEVTLLADCATATSWTPPPTAIGQMASTQLVVIARDRGNLDLALRGAAAADYAIDREASTCDDFGSLEANEPCVLALELAPSAEGPREAVLVIGATQVPLHGEGIAAPAGLVANLRNASSLHGLFLAQSRTAADPVDIDHARYTLSIRNAGTQTITPAPVELAGTGFTVESTGNCTLPLAPGNACEITVVTSHFEPGCSTGTLRVPSSAGTLEVPLSNMLVGGVTVIAKGPGQGRVVSSPAGIDCPGACTAVFTEPVTLTALPRDGQHFNGWSERICGEGDACTLAPVFPDEHGRNSAPVVTANFATKNARKLDVAFEGDGAGVVGFSGVAGSLGAFLQIPLAPSCGASCTRWIEPGKEVTLVSGTASRFEGFVDRCVGRFCDLGMLTGDTAVTARFTKAPGEAATLYPRVPVELGSFTPDGDMIVAGLDRAEDPSIRQTAALSRLSPTGEVRWTWRLGDQVEVCNLKVGASSQIYVIGRDINNPVATLFAFDPAGRLRWRRSLAYTPACNLAVAPNGDVSVETGASADLVRWSSAGDLIWSVPATVSIESPRDRVVVLDAAGTVGHLEQAGTELVVARYGANGAPLAPWSLGQLPPGEIFHRADVIAVPGGGAYVQHVMDIPLAQKLTLRTVRLDVTGAVVFDRSDPLETVKTDLHAPIQIGMTARTDGALFSWADIGRFTNNLSVYFAGANLQRFGATGVPVWSYNAAAAQPTPPTRSGGPPLDAPVVSSASCDASGRCAVFGTYFGVGGGPWIQIFPP